jgi:hypothetical protein
MIHTTHILSLNTFKFHLVMGEGRPYVYNKKNTLQLQFVSQLETYRRKYMPNITDLKTYASYSVGPGTGPVAKNCLFYDFQCLPPQPF